MSEILAVKAMDQAAREVAALLQNPDSNSLTIRESIFTLLERSNDIRKVSPSPHTQAGEFLILEAIRLFHARDPKIALLVLSEIMDNPERIEGRLSLSQMWAQDVANLSLEERSRLFPQVLDVFKSATQPGLKDAAAKEVLALSFYHPKIDEIGEALTSVFDYAKAAENRGLLGAAITKRSEFKAQIRDLESSLREKPGAPPPEATPLPPG